MIKHLSLASILVLSLATGCQKSTDLGRVQEESVALIKVHVNVLDQLQRRADALLQRGRTVGASAGPNTPGIGDAGRVLTEARAQLEQLRAQAQTAPASITTAAKSGHEEEILKVVDETVEKLDNGEALVRADLDAVEQWLALAESGSTRVAQAIPPRGTESDPSTSPNNPNPGATGDMSGTGNAAGGTAPGDTGKGNDQKGADAKEPAAPAGGSSPKPEIRTETKPAPKTDAKPATKPATTSKPATTPKPATGTGPKTTGAGAGSAAPASSTGTK